MTAGAVRLPEQEGCREAGRAQAIVTGDRMLLTLEAFRGVRLLRLREYLDSPGEC